MSQIRNYLLLIIFFLIPIFVILKPYSEKSFANIETSIQAEKIFYPHKEIDINSIPSIEKKELKSRDANVLTQKSLTPSDVNFTNKKTSFSHDDIINLSHLMNELSNYIEPEKGLQNFKKSELDSKENYLKSITQLQENYPETENDRKDFIRTRVVAVNFFLNSKHAQALDCELLLKKINEQHHLATRRSTQANLEYDTASIAQRCSKDFFASFSDFVNSQKFEDKLASQINYYLGQSEGTFQ